MILNNNLYTPKKMTLIYTGNSQGCTGKCDANCYEATQPECKCVCGGRNHGVGHKKALDNTRKYCDVMIEDWNKSHPGESVTIPGETLQLTFF